MDLIDEMATTMIYFLDWMYFIYYLGERWLDLTVDGYLGGD